MSDFIEAAKSARPRTAIKPPTPKAPLIDTTKMSPSLGMMADVVNNTAAPFQEPPDPKRGDAGWVEHKIGAVMGIVGAPFELLDTGFALVTAPLAALMPGFPAAVLGMPHLGTLHGHAHPPSLIPPNPVPTPLPSIGSVLCAGCVSVTIGGVFAARAGDLGLALTCFSFGPPFEIYTGSSNTWIGGSRAARMLDITRHCNPASKLGLLGAAMGAVGVAAGFIGSEASSNAGEALQASMQAAQAAADAVALAMSALLGIDPGLPAPATGAILLGNPTVLIGGFPVPDLLDLLGAMLKGLKKIGSKIGNSPTFKKLIGKVGLCNDKGEPVSSFTGAVYNDFEDYHAPSGFTWERHYKSSWNLEAGPFGYGFRHFFDRRLQLLRKRAVYETHDGEVMAFPRDERGRFIGGEGFTLTRLATGRYQLTTDRDEELEFVALPTTPPTGRLVHYKVDELELFLHYDGPDRLRTITESVGAFAVETRLVYDSEGHIVEVQHGPREAARQIISRYAYESGCLVAWQDALGATVRMKYDVARRMSQLTDRRGYSFHWQYDLASGCCIKSYGDDGLLGVEASYAGDTSSFKEVDGGEWIFKHFPDGIVSHLIDPLGGVLEYVRDKATGQIIKQIMPSGVEYQWLYDATGKLEGREDPFGQMVPPEDDEPDPSPPFEHAGPTAPKDVLCGRPFRELTQSLSGIPTATRYHLDALALGTTEATGAEPTRDAAGRVIEQPESDGTTRRFRYDPEGNIVAEQDSNGQWSQTSYTSWDLAATEKSPLGNVTHYEYTHRGDCKALVDANGNRTEYVRDQLQRVTEIHRYGRCHRRYLRNATDAVIEERDGSDATIVKYETDSRGLHLSASLASGEKYTYDYDPDGRLNQASSTLHEVVQRHEGNLLERDLRDGKGVEHTYYAGSNIARTTIFERFHVRYDYDTSSQLRVITPDGAIHLLWQQQDLVVRENGNGTTEAAIFDADERLASRVCFRRSQAHGEPFWTTSYRYDAEGALHYSVDSDVGPQRYEYDADRRIIAQHDHRGEQRYGYDPAGNLTSSARHRLIEHKPGNLVDHADFDHYDYDDRRRRSKHDRQGGPVVEYAYDSLDRLVEARFSDRTEVWRAAYDGIGRRLWREYGGRRTDFHWDGDRLAAERDPEGRLRIYVYANQDALVPFMWLDYESDAAPPESGKPYYLFTAPTGMPLRVEDADAREVWRARAVDAYGEIDESSGPCPTRLRFAGHFYDEHLGLFYNRFRDYDPALGRYLQPDRLGHAAGPNLIAYTANPLAEVDLRGLSVHRKGKGKKGGGKAGASEEGTPRGPARQASEPNLRALPKGKKRTPAQNKEARRFYRNNREEAMARWEQRTGKQWPTDENGAPQWCEHPRPLKDGGDPLHVEPGIGPDPNAIHSVPGPDGLTDHQRWGAMGPPARGKG